MSTFYVDRDGRNSSGVVGQDSLSSPGWSMVTRAGDPTKPFASIGAAITNVASSDTIIVRKEKTTTEYAKTVVSGKNPASKITIQAQAGETPNTLGFSIDNSSKLKFDGFRFVNPVFLGTTTAVNNIELFNMYGRSRSTTGAATGNVLAGTFSTCTFSNLDLRFSGTYTIDKAVVGFNVSVGGTANQFLGCRWDHFPGDAFNGPSGLGQDNWVFDGCVWSRTTDNGVVHADSLQWACGSDNLVIRNCMFFGGLSRLMVMPMQNTTGGTTGGGGHTNMHIYNNVWDATEQFGAQFYNCPGLEFINNTMNNTVMGNSQLGLYLPATQSTTLIPTTMWTKNVRLKNNILSGIKVYQDAGHGGPGAVTFVSDSGYNMIYDDAANNGYTTRTGDVVGAKPTYVDTSFDAVNDKLPNLRLVAGSRGINEGTLISDSTQMLGVPTTDADGKTRTGTKVDMGAYEFAGGTGGGGGSGGGTSSGTAGPNLGGSVVQDTSPAGSDWSNLNNILEEAGADNATVGLNSASSGGSSQRVRISAFALPVPAAGTVNGVTVTLRVRQTQAQQVHVGSIQLWAGGALVGTSKSSSTPWTTSTSYQTLTFGSPTDLWGHANAAALTASVLASDFTVAFIANNSSGTSSTAAVDWVKASAAWTTTTDVPDSPPVGSFTISPNPAVTLQFVTFDGTASTGRIDTYEWSVDNGLTYGFPDDNNDGILVDAHNAGVYSVRMRVTGPGGVNVTPAQTFTVSDSGTGGGTIGANVAISPNPGTVGTAVSFDMSASNGLIDTYELSFDNGSSYASLGANPAYSRFFPAGTYSVIGRVTGSAGTAVSTAQQLVVNAVTTPPPSTAIYLPYVPQVSAKYTLTAPSGLKIVFNDPTDADYVGELTDVSGLDSADVRESASDLAQADGGQHGDFFFGRRPITLTCKVYNANDLLTRDARIDKIRRVVKECMRADGVLVWTNNPAASYLPMMTTVRMQQPLRISGPWVKDVLISMVSQYAQLFSADVQTTTKAAGAVDANVRNRGDYPSYPVLRLTNPSTNAGASAEFWQFPSLSNVGTGTQFRMTGKVWPGEILEFDMLRHRGVVIQRSSTSYNYINTNGLAGTLINRTIDYPATKWPAVIPGINSFQSLHSGTAPTGATWTLTWRSAWS